MLLRFLVLCFLLPVVSSAQTGNTAALLVQGFTAENDTLDLVKANSVFKTLPDTVIARGTPLKTGWRFDVPVNEPRNLYLRKNGKRVLQLFIQPGDSIIASKERDSVFFFGTGSEWNTLRQKYVRLVSSTYLNDRMTKVSFDTLEAFLDSALNAVQTGLQRDLEGLTMPGEYMKHIQASWYSQWATPRCMHLHNHYFVDPSNMRPVSGNLLGFISKIPDSILYPPYVTPFEQFFDLFYRIYLYETMFQMKKNMIDQDVLLQTAKVLPKKHTGILRDNLMLAFVASMVEDMKDWLEPVIDSVMKDYKAMKGNATLFGTARYLVKKNATGKSK